MSGINVSVAPGDMAKFEASMRARAARAGGDMRVGIIRAALALTRTLGASTRVAKEKRDVKKMEFTNAAYATGYKQAYGWSYGVLFYRQKPGTRLRRIVPITQEYQTALAAPARAIKRRGLAKRVLWSWVKSMGATPSGGEFNDAPPQDIADRFAAFSSRGMSGGEASASATVVGVTMEDSLPYVMEAFKTSGRQAVGTAVGRAAAILRHDAAGWAKKVAS